MHGFTLCAALLMSLLVVVYSGWSSSSQPSSGATKCCMPDQWEGRQDSVYTEVINNVVSIAHIKTEVAYDAVNERLAYVTNRIVDNIIPFRNKIIYLHKEGSFSDYGNQPFFVHSNVVYNLDLISGNCTKTALTKAFKKRCVPAFSQVTDASLVYGNASNYLQATRHEYVTIGDFGNLKYGTVSVTDNCIPIVERMHTYVKKELRTKATDFFDITTGISSEDVFAIPAECSNARRKRSEEMDKYNFE